MVAFEIGFDIFYLIAIWWLALAMLGRRNVLAPGIQREAELLAWGFALLALGDSGHVGFRVAAYALGGLERNQTVLNLGSLATEITLTVLYMLILEAWRVHNGRARGPLYWVILAAGVLRLLCLVPLVGQVNGPQAFDGWFVARNIFLIVQGLGAAALIVRDAWRKGDPVFGWLGALICLSYLFYIPVFLFVARFPMVGMLMVPKTLAYLGMAWVTYRAYFGRAAQERQALTGYPG